LLLHELQRAERDAEEQRLELGATRDALEEERRSTDRQLAELRERMVSLERRACEPHQRPRATRRGR
jgi:hypothetical protein